MEYIENRTFDEIKVGDSASLVRTLTKDDISIFAAMSGDINPAHVDAEYAKSDMFHKIIAHGMWGAITDLDRARNQATGSRRHLPGSDTKFLKPVGLGDRITVSVKARAKDPEKHRVTLDCQCSNERGDVVIAGTAEVIAPLEKVKRPRAVLPRDPGLRRRCTPPAVDRSGQRGCRRSARPSYTRSIANSLLGALDAAAAGLIIPVLVGPEEKVRRAAVEANVDLWPL